MDFHTKVILDKLISLFKLRKISVVVLTRSSDKLGRRNPHKGDVKIAEFFYFPVGTVAPVLLASSRLPMLLTVASRV
jgi:hypothetical protein